MSRYTVADAIRDLRLDKQVPDTEILAGIVLAEQQFPNAVANLRAGKTSAMNFLIGVVARSLKAADPKRIKQLLEERVNG